MARKSNLLIFLVLAIFLISFSSAVTNIPGCGYTLAAPGTYQLTGDINASFSTCLEINSSNVVLEGNGYMIRPNNLLDNGGTGLDLFPEDYPNPLTNVTIRNVNFEGWDTRSIELFSVNNSLFSNIHILFTGDAFSHPNAIAISQAYNNVFNNVEINSSYISIGLSSGENNTFNNLIINNCGSNDSNGGNQCFASLYNWESAVSLGNVYNNLKVYNSPVIDATASGGLDYVNGLTVGNENGSVEFLGIINFGTTSIGGNFIYNNLAINNYPLLNRSAIITFNNMPGTFTHPIIVKDAPTYYSTNYGTSCSDNTHPSCHNFTSLNAGTVVFNVSSWGENTLYSDSSWSIAETDINMTDQPTYYTPTSGYSYSYGQEYDFRFCINSIGTVDTISTTINGRYYSNKNGDITLDSVCPSFQGGNMYLLNISGLPAGTFNYDIFANNSLGLDYNLNGLSYDIIKLFNSGYLTFNPSQAVTNPTETNVSGTGNYKGLGDSDVIYTLYRDGVPVTNPEIRTFSPGTYVYSMNSTEGENYTSNPAFDTQPLYVSPPPYFFPYIYNPLNQTYANNFTQLIVHTDTPYPAQSCIGSLDGGLTNFSMVNTSYQEPLDAVCNDNGFNSCFQVTDETLCGSTSGCSWNNDISACEFSTGLTDCSLITDGDTCTNIGCDWVDNLCSGPPLVSCSFLDESGCGNTGGQCTYDNGVCKNYNNGEGFGGSCSILDQTQCSNDVSNACTWQNAQAGGGLVWETDLELADGSYQFDAWCSNVTDLVNTNVVFGINTQAFATTVSGNLLAIVPSGVWTATNGTTTEIAGEDNFNDCNAEGDNLVLVMYLDGVDTGNTYDTRTLDVGTYNYSLFYTGTSSVCNNVPGGFLDSEILTITSEPTPEPTPSGVIGILCSSIVPGISNGLLLIPILVIVTLLVGGFMLFNSGSSDMGGMELDAVSIITMLVIMAFGGIIIIGVLGGC